MEINTNEKEEEKHKKITKGKIRSHKVNEGHCRNTYQNLLREKIREFGSPAEIDNKCQWLKNNILEVEEKS